MYLTLCTFSFEIKESSLSEVYCEMISRLIRIGQQLRQNVILHIVFILTITWLRFPNTKFINSLQIYHSFLQVYINVKIVAFFIWRLSRGYQELCQVQWIWLILKNISLLDRIWSLWLVRFSHSPTNFILWLGRMIFSVSRFI
jgi:ethanolamine transporter EutH